MDKNPLWFETNWNGKYMIKTEKKLYYELTTVYIRVDFNIELEMDKCTQKSVRVVVN